MLIRHSLQAFREKQKAGMILLAFDYKINDNC